MVQHQIRFKKGIAIELRKKGFSYRQIETSISIPKSTIAYWVRSVPLTEIQLQKLKDNRSRSARENARKKKSKIAQRMDEIQNASVRDIRQISKRELWLMGIILYWKSLGANTDLKKGILFTSSNPDIVKFFLGWLRNVGDIKRDELKFYILSRRKTVEQIKHWAEILQYPEEQFRDYPHQSKKSLLQIRVKSSSLLVHQIIGWIEGIKKELH